MGGRVRGHSGRQEGQAGCQLICSMSTAAPRLHHLMLPVRLGRSEALALPL